SSLASFRADIEAGFDLLHIDTCMDLAGVPSVDQAIKRPVTPYGEGHQLASPPGRAGGVGIGFEDQGGGNNHPPEFREQIMEVCELLAADGLPAPAFAVAQTGTKVVETHNCGALRDAPMAVGFAVEMLAAVCREAGTALKAHNADYLDRGAIR